MGQLFLSAALGGIRQRSAKMQFYRRECAHNMEFKDFADILKTHINVDADDDEFFMELFDNYLRDPTDEEMQKLKDKAKKKAEKTKKHVEPESWNPFDDIDKDAQERLFRGQRPFPVPKLKKVYTRRHDHRFAEYINHQKNTVVAHIEEDFCRLIPGFTDEQNIGYACQDWLTQFIQREIDRDRNTQQEPPSSRMTAQEFQASFYVDWSEGKIHYGNESITIPPDLIPPEEIADEEDFYVGALLDAYTQAAGIPPVTKEDIHLLKKTYRENFSEQRINYYAAVRITRIIRECFLNDKEELDRWLNESADYISITRRDDYDDGYQRLKAVLKKVVDCRTTSAVDQCGRLIGAKERQGVCHLLVNNKAFVWVNEDDEDDE